MVLAPSSRRSGCSEAAGMYLLGLLTYSLTNLLTYSLTHLQVARSEAADIVRAGAVIHRLRL